MGHPRSRNWTLDFEPAFSPRFSFPLSPRSFFHTGQRFPISNHVTSGCMSPRSLFHTRQRFPISNHVTSGSMSPRSLFPTGQRYPHPTSGHDVTRPIRSLHMPQTSPLYYSLLTVIAILVNELPRNMIRYQVIIFYAMNKASESFVFVAVRILLLSSRKFSLWL